MTLAALQQLRDLQKAMRDACDRYAKDVGPSHWGWPGGQKQIPSTYLIATPRGPLFLGPDDQLDNRWWLGIALADDLQASYAPQFELNIAKDEPNNRLSVEFESLGPRVLQVRHKGWFTVVTRVASEEFFQYYESAPGRWPILPTANGDRLVLFTFDLDHFGYQQFYAFAIAMADFADYLTFYKDSIRENRENE